MSGLPHSAFIEGLTHHERSELLKRSREYRHLLARQHQVLSGRKPE